MSAIVAFLAFDGNCGEAMEFYRKCLGAELYVVSFPEEPGDSPAKARIKRATLMKGRNMLLMAADTTPGTPIQQGDNVSLAIHCKSLPETERFFTALGEKGIVTVPLHSTCRGSRFGALGELTDQFGVRWLFNFVQSE